MRREHDLRSPALDEVPKAAYKAVTDAFKEKSGIAVTTNVVAHNDFQNKINTYLQGSPGRFVQLVRRVPHAVYAGKGLLAPTSMTSGKTSAATTPTR